METFAAPDALLTRRRFLPALAAVPIAGRHAAIPPPPPGLLFEGRRLAAAFLDESRAWVECQAAHDRTVPDDAPIAVHRKWEERQQDLCGRQYAAQQALIRFVVKIAGWSPLPSGHGTHVAELDTWPAAAVEQDGVLWVVSQGGNGDGGELLLCRVVLADVARPGSKGGAL